MEPVDEPGYDSISDEEKDGRPRFPFTYASTGVKRDYTNLEKENQQESCEWSAILDEANELAGLHGKAYNSFKTSAVPEEKRYHKGGKGCSKIKFSFKSLPNKEDFSRDCSSSKDETCNSLEDDIEEPAPRDHFELGNEDNMLVGAPSVSEVLEDMQKTDPSLRSSLAVNNIKGKERQASSSKRTSMHLGNRILNNKDTFEFTGDISSEDEYIGRDHRTAQIVKGQTMADLFQEAFRTSMDERTDIRGSNNFGFHGRLQHVMQLEKHGHINYLKELQTTSNKLNCINARILSRTLEAKLTVCEILFGESNKRKTIIFSSTFCSNVELEVGSVVCIHPPWKEVEVNGVDETIILCSFFSPIK